MIGFPKRPGFLLGGVFLLLISAGVYCGSDNGGEDGPGEIAVGSRAPDFSLLDYSGQEVKLSDFRGGHTVVLVFLRSFFWPYSHEHLEVLQEDYEQFQARGAEIIVVGPGTPEDFSDVWESKSLAFIGLPDEEGRVSELYRQEYKSEEYGLMPAVFIIGQDGILRYIHYGAGMDDIPDNGELFQVLEGMSE